MNEQPPTNLGTLSSNGTGGYVVQVERGGGGIRTFGGFRSESEARACIERAFVLTARRNTDSVVMTS